MLDVNPSLLRFWEKQFKQIQPKTNARGKRAYRQEDIDVIRRIYDLVKVQGLTLEGARKAMSARKGEAKERGAQAASAAQAASDVATPAVDPSELAKRQEAVSRLKKVRQRLLEARAVVQS